MAAFTREGQKILMAAVFAPDSGEKIVEDAAIQIAVDHVFHISTEEAILGGETVVIDLLKRLKMIFNATVILGFMWLARAVCGRNIRSALRWPLCMRNRPRNSSAEISSASGPRRSGSLASQRTEPNCRTSSKSTVPRSQASMARVYLPFSPSVRGLPVIPK